ncbi:MAG: HAMP domain-containing histidine kinase, partial [Gemmatimonadales bacterium]|nr:HAMP domain-containing histidine kinase [Gemmatimonadales bacterium]
VHQYLDVLKQLGDTEEAAAKRQEWLERCLSRTEEMQGLITDWLTLARIESETLSRRRIGVDLGRIVPGILRSYEDMAAKRGVTFDADVPENSYVVLGDPNCVTVLLDNLIVNAVKYNRPGGRVTVTVDQLDGDVVISIADTGLGIPVEYREYLFDEFFRIKEDGAEAATGSGLGLPICKRIVSEMGGSIEVESEEAVGSTFRVRLPVYRGEAGASAPEEAQSELEFAQDIDR